MRPLRWSCAAWVLLAACQASPALAARVRRPDLVVTAVGAPPARISPGQGFRASAAVRNRGRAAARASRTRFYLSLDARRAAGDVVLGSRAVQRLGAGRALRGSATVVVPAVTRDGAYRLLACADAGGVVRESDEHDNCRASTARIAVSVPPLGGAPAPGPAATADRDGDGTPDAADCAPDDASVHPGAADEPDLAFVDSNCDGVDGDASRAVFVSPSGSDSAAGTRAAPLRTVQAAVVTGREAFVAAGSYAGPVSLPGGARVFGGYDPVSWARSGSAASTITGAPEAVLADAATGVTLQLLTLRGTGVAPSAQPFERSVYGLRALRASSLTLDDVTVSATAGATGAAGSAASPGTPSGSSQKGGDGGQGASGANSGGLGGTAGTGTGTQGGTGGHGGYSANGGRAGTDGSPAGSGTTGHGGPGGTAPTACLTDSGGTGSPGIAGDSGAPGAGGAGGVFSTTLAADLWAAPAGGTGGTGTVGRGGGGGGGGGGGFAGGFCNADTGGGGGGGGAGGQPGTGGGGGGFGGGSIAVYLSGSSITLTGGSLTAGDGGTGGTGAAGGAGATGGGGGAGGPGADESGAGGSGGSGGTGGKGGAGGGGPGGPSYGIFKTGGAATAISGTAIHVGTGGPGGPAGTGSSATGAPGASAAVAG